MLRNIIQKDLSGLVNYKGVANNVKETLRSYDVVVDFSLTQSFGLCYIEAVLNGKPLLCFSNEGSEYVLSSISDVIVHNYTELLDKLLNIHEITRERLIENYILISKKFSREVVVNNFIEFLDGIDR